MTGDEDIVFGDVSVREPVRMRRPDRDPRHAAIAVAIPRADDLPIFLDYRPADAIERHALSDTSVELGGILLGKECRDDETGDPFVLITQALEAKHYQNTQASFTYTHDSWEEITRERDASYPDLDIVGWYHTHPDFGIFLSSHDLFIHHHFFANPLQVAYVVDPIRQTRGFFQWREGGMAALRGFFLSGDRTERMAISKVVNELENLPNPEGGHGLSPRLEAELITMLSRPNSPTVIERGSGALIFGLIGSLLGALAVMLIFWLNTLSQQLQSQSVQLVRLEQAQTTTPSAVQARLNAKEQALDALLAEVKVGSTGDSIRERFTQTLQRINELEAQLKLRETEKEALSQYADISKKNAVDLSLELADLRNEYTRTEKELHRRLDESLTDAQKFKNEAQLKDNSLGTSVASNSGQSNILMWTALGGWSAFALALAGLVVLWKRGPEELPRGESLPPMRGTTRVVLPGAHENSGPHVIE